MTSSLIILKYTAALCTMFYGVYATLNDFHYEENGRKKLSIKGKLGIFVLILSSVLALSSDGVKDIHEQYDRAETARTEKEARKESQNRDDRITSRLADSLLKLDDVSGSLSEALTKLDTNSRMTSGISSDLGVQLKVTSGVSRQLARAVAELNQTSKTTNSVLTETVGRIDSLDVYLSVMVDPWGLKDESGRPILSPESQRLLEEDKKGTIDLSDYDESKPLIRDLLTHYDAIRRRVFSEWSTGIAFSRDDDDSSGLFDFLNLIPDMAAIQQGDQNVSGFIIMEFSDTPQDFTDKHQGYKALVCLVKYSIPPNRYIGIRKFTDLNGAEWRVVLTSDADLLKLESALLSVGGSIGGPHLKMEDEEITSERKGEYEGSKKIPMDHFQSG